MTEQHNRIFSMVKQHWLYGGLLSVTLLFFLYKGFSYAIIGSYIPILVIFTILILFAFGLYKSEKAFIRILGLWSVLMILWACIRLLLSSVNQFVKPIPEGHIDAQLGIAGTLLSLAFLFCGIYLGKYKKSVFVTNKTGYSDGDN